MMIEMNNFLISFEAKLFDFFKENDLNRKQIETYNFKRGETFSPYNFLHFKKFVKWNEILFVSDKDDEWSDFDYFILCVWGDIGIYLTSLKNLKYIRNNNLKYMTGNFHASLNLLRDIGMIEYNFINEKFFSN